RSTAFRSRGLLLGAARLQLLKPGQPLTQLGVLPGQFVPPGTRGQCRVGLPPVDAHLLRLVDGGHDEAQLDGEQLDVEQIDADVTRDDDPLVEHPFQDVGQIGSAAPPAVRVTCPTARGLPRLPPSAYSSSASSSYASSPLG